jgi:hypothetical protein
MYNMLGCLPQRIHAAYQEVRTEDAIPYVVRTHVMLGHTKTNTNCNVITTVEDEEFRILKNSKTISQENEHWTVD